MARERVKTKYPGVYFRKVNKSGIKEPDEVYYIVFKKDGRVVEEKVGSKFSDAMTPAKASVIRSDRMQGKRESQREIKQKQKALKQTEKSKMTLLQIWEHYQVLNPNKKSLVTDRYNFQYLVSCENKTPDEITTFDVTKIKTTLSTRGLKPATIKHAVVLLRMLIRFGAREGLCALPDISKLHFEVPKLDNKKTEMLNAEQILTLKKALDEEVDQNAASFMRLALATGMRKGALMNLKWDDVDFDNHFITLRGDVAKKGTTERIPMSESAKTILLSIKKHPTSLYVFPGKDGGPRKEFRRVAQRVKKNAGLPDDFRPLHGLRHAYASILASSGKVDLYTLQKLLTHSSPQMTQRYAHLADEAMQRAASVVDEVFVKEK